jgi:hypothetical protein
MMISLKGEIVLSLRNGKIEKKPQPLSECREIDLCDRELIDKIMAGKPGDLLYGDVLRFYNPAATSETGASAAGISVAYRTDKAIYLLTLDYRQLRDHLTDPTFPYDTKRNLQQAYKNGNYIYIVDSHLDVIVHPNYGHVVGIDPATGKKVPPMKSDADENTHPINIAAYQQGKLKAYFDRLLSRSFVQKGVDIFQAPNLFGTKRVLSVAPILLSRGQYKKTGVFGHVVIGCNVEFFEEPTESFIPYY